MESNKFNQQTQTNQSSFNDEYWAKVNELRQVVMDNIDVLLDEFDLEYRNDGRKIVCACPVHGSDNSRSMNLYLDNSSYKCRTHNCHMIFGKDVIGFVRGMLSKKKGWLSVGDNIVRYGEAINFLCNLYKVNFNNIQVDLKKYEKKRFSATNWSLTEQEKEVRIPIAALKSLEIPSKYALARGFSEEILRKYYIGECYNPNKEMAFRCTVPIFDINAQYVIGCAGRSIFEKCPVCGFHHNPKFQHHTFSSKANSKWITSTGLEKSKVLYNYWSAKDKIKETRKVFLTEGPFDCLKLVQAGIINSVAVLGGDFSEFAEILLEKCGTSNIIVLMDNDDAGSSFKETIKKKLYKLYKLHFPTLIKKDVGEMSSEEIRELLSSYL